MCHEIMDCLSSKITMDNTNIQETVNSENECFVEPPEKKRKIQLHSTDRESQSKIAKVLEIVLGKTPEVPDIDRLKQTVSKSPKAHFYRKKYDSVLSANTSFARTKICKRGAKKMG